MSLGTTFHISGSALTAQRLRMNVIAGNIANAETTRVAEGGPYRARQVYFEPLPTSSSVDGGVGVAVSRILSDTKEPRLVMQPDHPDADEDGYVAYPNIDLSTEMVDLLAATRAYEANVTVVNTAKTMAMRALDIGRG